MGYRIPEPGRRSAPLSAVRARPGLVVLGGWQVGAVHGSGTLAAGGGERYTSAMREYIVSALVLLCGSAASAQTVAAGWKVVKDAKGLCQIAVPAEWTLLDASTGAAVLHDAGTGIAAVTAQPGQAFQPLTANLLRVMDVPKEKMFENTAKRIFYQDKTSKNAEDPNAFSASVPGGGGSCSCHLVVLPSVPGDVAKTITLSIGPVAEKPKT
jgi:hypothetical protein